MSYEYIPGGSIREDKDGRMFLGHTDLEIKVVATETNTSPPTIQGNSILLEYNGRELVNIDCGGNRAKRRAYRSKQLKSADQRR